MIIVSFVLLSYAKRHERHVSLKLVVDALNLSIQESFFMKGYKENNVFEKVTYTKKRVLNFIIK